MSTPRISSRPFVLASLAVICGCNGGMAAPANTGGAGGDSPAAASGGRTGSGGATGSGGTTATGGVSGTGGPAAGGRAGAGGGASIGGSTGLGGGLPASSPSYFIGADISQVQTDGAGVLYTDNDGTRKEFLQLMKGHGFNFMRVRTFVDPTAADGNNPNGFYDIAHTVAFGKRIKDAGMGLLLDFHYADNWADPGKQCVPIAWRAAATIGALATMVHDYTTDAVSRLVAGGARPDMVQIGNEITPGMLIHQCGPGGLPTGTNPVNGALSNWNNLGPLLKAAGQAIREIDPGIKIVIHLDRGGDLSSSRAFIMNAMTQGVPFDVFAESTYTLYQGPPAGWLATFTQLAALFPTLKFISAEYGPEQRAINDILFNMPNQRGIGTFYWEATHSGADNAGHLLFSNRVAQPDLLLYDLMKSAYASRL